MKFIKQKFLITFLTLLVLSPAVQANDEEDPCNQLPGQWTGTFLGSTGCRWRSEGQFSKFKETVRFVYRTYAITPKNEWDAPCLEGEGVLTGTCKDAIVKMTLLGLKFEGTVMDNFLFLSNKHFEGKFTKR